MCVNTRAESHDIAWSSKYTFSIAYGSLIKCRKASYKTYQHVTNKLKKSEQRWTDQSSNHEILISERWELRRRPSTSASRIISSTSSSVSFSSAEWYAYTSQGVAYHMATPCTLRNPMWCLVWYISYGSVQNRMAQFRILWIPVAWSYWHDLEGQQRMQDLSFETN